MTDRLTTEETEELAKVFADVINYESDDPGAPIDVLTYRAPDGDTCLHMAAHKGDLRAVKLLVRAGLDVNALGDMGYTPLHYAATSEIVQFLVQNGADAGIKNEFGNAPIGWNGK